MTRERRPRAASWLMCAMSLLLLLNGGARIATAQSTSTLTVGTPTVDSNGVKYYPVTSVYQNSQQTVRVLEPTNPVSGKPRRILFVLPVDAGVDSTSSAYSDGLEELRLLDVPNRFNVTLIAPAFTYVPWYGDNVEDPKRRMESFIVDDLVPFGDTFAQSSVPQRYLIGFSKSGWGVLALLLRHPAVFNGGASWDSPAQLNSIDRFGDLPINFGNQANLSLYNVPALVASNAAPFQQQNRLWISGDQAIFYDEMNALHQLLTNASIPHTWVQGGSREHTWGSGWLDGALTDLDANATLTAPQGNSIAPPRTGGLPAGTLPSGTTQMTLRVKTDTASTCHYAASTQGVSYASMTGLFSSTDGTTHTSVVTGLADGSSYTYFVRCQDNSSNLANTDDYAISFTIAGDTGGTTGDGSSNFLGSESPLSENGVWDTPGSWSSLSKSNGAYAVGANSAARLVTPAIGANQYAEITYDQDPGSASWAGVMTRVQGPTNGSGYLAIVYSGSVLLYRADDGAGLSFSQLASAPASVGTAPRKLRLESQGTTHRVYFNDTLLITYTDAANTYTAGQPGIAATVAGGPTVKILTFASGALDNSGSGGGSAQPPVRSAGQPTGQLPSGTTQTTLSLATDVASTCHYATTAGVPYASMTGLFSSTDGTTHTSVVTGLADGGSYTYFVRCQGTSSNLADADDYAISFSVTAASGGSAAPGTSTFSGVESPLSENGVWDTPGSWSSLRKNNGAYTTSANAAARLVTPAIGADQYAEITYDQDPGSASWAGVMTRVQGPANGSGYLAIVYAGEVRLYRTDDNGGLSFSQLASAAASVGTAPRKLRLESQGTTHRVYFNDALLITYTDTANTYAAGQPGIAATSAGGPTVKILTFSSGVVEGSGSGGGSEQPPVRSSGLPTGQLPSGSTQATLSLATDVASTCHYATTAGVPYASMTGLFSTTNGTAHTSTVTGLTNGSSYTYYVRCQGNSSGLADADDYAISFSVAAASGGSGGSNTPGASTFSGVESPLFENGVWDTPGSWMYLKKNNGAYTTSANAAARLVAPAIGADQYAEITYDQDPGSASWAGVMTRIQGPANGSGYLAIVYAGEVRLYRTDDNGGLSFSLLTSAPASVGTAPRKLRLESQGTTHRVYFNDALLITYTDTANAYAAGQPGIAATSAGGPVVKILTFASGALDSTTSSGSAQPPILSSGLPTGQLPAGSTQATLSLATDVASTCHYATTAGVPFASMTGLFSSTDGTTHTSVVTGLTDGSSYTYYARCQGNSSSLANTADYAISFSVAPASGGSADPGTSSFIGVESPLSENGMWDTPASWEHLGKNNGVSTTSANAAARLVTPVTGPDQYAEITYDQDPGSASWVGVMTRIQGQTNGSGYLAIVYAGEVRLYRADTSAGLNFSLLASAPASVGTAPRKLRLESQGKTHRVYFNDTLFIAYTDLANIYTDGQPGIAATSAGGPAVKILTFAGGALSGGTE